MATSKSKATARAAKKRTNQRARPRAGSTKLSMAAKADRHICYQLSVQCVEAEIDFVDEQFKHLRGRRCELIREDFCGTANTSCEWVRRHRKARAIGVDLDPDPLEWGRANNIAKLKPAQRERVSLLQKNVLDVTTPKVDAVLAMNFSWQIFRTRATLREYFTRVRQSLVADGLLFLDVYGGYESFQETVDEREINDQFDYIWDQHRFDPISHDMECHIHFHFADGSKLNKAFEYTWRLWTMPELREILDEAGYRRSTVYWEGTDEGGEEGNGVYEPAERGEADPSWVCYVVAEK